jgi:anti-anti-sigma factor
LDVRSVAEVRDALHAAIDAGDGDLVVDVSGVELVDAAGLGVLVGADRRADAPAGGWSCSTPALGCG